jgi:imidazolonepropionase-like amidohydrolase
MSEHGRKADGFGRMVKFGMTPAEAIHAATIARAPAGLRRR